MAEASTALVRDAMSYPRIVDFMGRMLSELSALPGARGT